MSFRWTKYLDLAQELIAGQTPIPEAKARSVISRAYYAAFHEAKAYLEKKEGVPSNVDNIHAHVITRFGKIKDRDPRLCRVIGDDLDTLRRDRNKADYDDTFQGGLTEIRKKAKEAVIVAARIIANVARL